jgi:hypothetical protein
MWCVEKSDEVDPDADADVRLSVVIAGQSCLYGAD